MASDEGQQSTDGAMCCAAKGRQSCHVRPQRLYFRMMSLISDIGSSRPFVLSDWLPPFLLPDALSHKKAPPTNNTTVKTVDTTCVHGSCVQRNLAVV